jgi:murein DD-endopeptidase MepM/ murein hydrolase activator NlpD
MRHSRVTLRTLALGTAVFALQACSTDPSQLDWDLRSGPQSTAAAARGVAAAAPVPDARGVISYPGYQVAVARQGDTVASVAARVGVSPEALASYNATTPTASLNQGAVLALPTRVAEPVAGTGSLVGSTPPASTIEVTTLASSAIDKATGTVTETVTVDEAGVEPVRHKVARGETAYTIARLYGVPVKSLAEWNGLGPDLEVREGQYLIIPVLVDEQVSATEIVTEPGVGSPTPEPPSAAKPLPAEKPQKASEPADGTPESPDLSKERTAASAATFAMPADGKIIRAYAPQKKNDGIDIGAAAGSPVKAAADGTVAIISQDTNQVPVLILRHADNLLTVYANVDGIKVKKGDTVKRGQTIATVRKGDPAFLHFEVRKGPQAVDPMPYLQ